MNWISVLIGIGLIVLIVTTAITAPDTTLNYAKAMLKSGWIIGKWTWGQSKLIFTELKDAFPKNATKG